MWVYCSMQEPRPFGNRIIYFRKQIHSVIETLFYRLHLSSPNYLWYPTNAAKDGAPQQSSCWLCSLCSGVVWGFLLFICFSFNPITSRKEDDITSKDTQALNLYMSFWGETEDNMGRLVSVGGKEPQLQLAWTWLCASEMSGQITITPRGFSNTVSELRRKQKMYT